MDARIYLSTKYVDNKSEIKKAITRDLADIQKDLQLDLGINEKAIKEGLGRIDDIISSRKFAKIDLSAEIGDIFENLSNSKLTSKQKLAYIAKEEDRLWNVKEYANSDALKKISIFSPELLPKFINKINEMTPDFEASGKSLNLIKREVESLADTFIGRTEAAKKAMSELNDAGYGKYALPIESASSIAKSYYKEFVNNKDKLSKDDQEEIKKRILGYVQRALSIGGSENDLNADVLDFYNKNKDSTPEMTEFLNNIKDIPEKLRKRTDEIFEKMVQDRVDAIEKNLSSTTSKQKVKVKTNTDTAKKINTESEKVIKETSKKNTEAKTEEAKTEIASINKEIDAIINFVKEANNNFKKNRLTETGALLKDGKLSSEYFSHVFGLDKYGRPTDSKGKLQLQGDGDTIIHSHMKGTTDNLRFSVSDLMPLSESIKKLILSCGDELLTLDMSGVTIDDDVRFRLIRDVTNTWTSIMTMFGASIRDNGSPDTTTMSDEAKTKASNVFNSWLQNYIEQLGGSLTSGKLVDDSIVDTTQERIKKLTPDIENQINDIGDELSRIFEKADNALENENVDIDKELDAYRQKHGIKTHTNPLEYLDSKDLSKFTSLDNIIQGKLAKNEMPSERMMQEQTELYRKAQDAMVAAKKAQGGVTQAAKETTTEIEKQVAIQNEAPKENVIAKQQEVAQKEIKETNEELEKQSKITYHYGNLNGDKKNASHQVGSEVKGLLGIRNGGRAWADGTGTYTTHDINSYNKVDFNDPLKKLYAIDTSKLKLFEAHTEENAKAFYDFQHTLERYIISMVTEFRGFDKEVDELDEEKLYSKGQEIFGKTFMTFEQFHDFMEEMQDMMERLYNEDGTTSIARSTIIKKKYGIDDVKTRFLKRLGYQGTDLSGTSYDTLQSGSVIFDDNAKENIIATGKSVEELQKNLNDVSMKASKASDTIKEEQKEIKKEVENTTNAIKEEKKEVKEATVAESPIKEQQIEAQKEIEKTTKLIDEQEKKEEKKKATVKTKITKLPEANMGRKVTAQKENKEQESKKQEVKQEEEINLSVEKRKELYDQIIDSLQKISSLQQTIDSSGDDNAKAVQQIFKDNIVNNLKELGATDVTEEQLAGLEESITKKHGIGAVINDIKKAFGIDYPSAVKDAEDAQEKLTQAVTETSEKLKEQKDLTATESSSAQSPISKQQNKAQKEVKETNTLLEEQAKKVSEVAKKDSTKKKQEKKKSETNVTVNEANVEEKKETAEEKALKKKEELIKNIITAYETLSNSEAQYNELSRKKDDGFATKEELALLDQLIEKRKIASSQLKKINQDVASDKGVQDASLNYSNIKASVSTQEQTYKNVEKALKSLIDNESIYQKSLETTPSIAANVTNAVKKYSEALDSLSRSMANVNKEDLPKNLQDLYSEYEQNRSNVAKKHAKTLLSGQVGRLESVENAVGSNQSASAQQYLAKVNEQIQKINEQIENVDKLDIVSDDDIRQLDIVNSNLVEITSNLVEQQKDYKLADTNKVKNLISDLEAYKKKASSMSTEYTQEIDKMVSALSSNNITQTVFDDISDKFKSLRKEVKAAGQDVQSFSDLLRGRFKALGAYLLSFASVYKVWDVLKQGFNTIHEFDDALTEMRKVSDETMKSLQAFQNESFDLASSVGTTGLQIQQSTADWMRLGESLKDAQESARVSTVLMNVSEFDSISEATESLVAMSAAFKDLDKIEIVDKLNKIGNDFSISTDGLATALQGSASALTTAGNTIDEAIALITAGNAVVQNPAQVGKGIRTIALRLTGTKVAAQQLQEEGEEIDGMLTTQSKLRETIKEATKVASNNNKGFDILKDNGAYKSTFEILQGISEVYQEIVEKDQKYGTKQANLLLETLAGKNRANIAASILQNPEMLNSVYAESQDAFGSAMEENEKYMDSISGHLNQLKNDWQSLWANAINRDVINFFIDLADAILKVIDKIGIINTALGGGAAIGLFQGVFGKGGIKGGTSLGKSLFDWLASQADSAKVVKETSESIGDVVDVATTAAPALAEFASESAETAKSASILSVGLDRTKKAFQGLWAVIANNKILAVAAGLATIATIIATYFGDKYNAFSKQTLDEVKEIKNQYDELNKTHNEHKEYIDSISESYSKLAKSSNVNLETNQNISLSTEDYQEYLDINNKIAEMYPELVKGYDAQGNAILDLKGNVDALTESLEAEAKAAANTALSGGKNKDVNSIVDAYNNSQKSNFLSILLDNLTFWDGVNNIGGTISEKQGKEILESMLGMSFSDFKNWELLGSEGDRQYEAKTSLLKLAGIDKVSNEADFNLAKKQMLAFIDELDAAISERVNDVKWLANLFMLDSSQFEELSNESKDLAGRIVNNLNQDIIEEWKGDSEKLTNEIVKSQVDEIIKQIGNADSELSDENIFNKLLDFNTHDSTSINNAVSYINSLYKKIKATNTISDANLDLVFESLGLNDVIDISKRMNESISRFASLNFGSETYSELNDYTKNFSRDQAELWLKTTNGITDATEAISKYEDALSKVSLAFNASDILDIPELSNQLNTINALITNSTSASGLTTEDLDNVEALFGSLDKYDPRTLFENTANGIHLNRQELNELTKAYEKQNQLEIDSKMKELQESYDATKKKLEGLDRTSVEYQDTLSQLSAINDNINALKQLQSQYDGLTNAFKRYQDALNSADERQQYEATLSGYDSAKKLKDRGWTGDAEFKSYVDLLTYGDQSIDAAFDYAERFDELKKKITVDGKNLGYSVLDFFTKDSNGESTIDGVYNFFDAVQKAFGETYAYINSQGKLTFDFTDGREEEIAKAFNIDITTLQGIEKSIVDANGSLMLDVVDALDEIGISAVDAEKKLQELNESEESALSYSGKKFDFQSTDIETLNAQIADAKQALDSISEEGKIDFNVEGANEALTVLYTLLERKKQIELNSDIVMHVDVEENSIDPLQNTIQYVQQLQQSIADLNEQKSLHPDVDTSSIEENIKSIISTLQSPEYSEYLEGLNLTASLNIEPEEITDEQIDNIKNQISNIDEELLLKVGVDEDSIEGLKDELPEQNLLVHISNFEDEYVKITDYCRENPIQIQVKVDGNSVKSVNVDSKVTADSSDIDTLNEKTETANKQLNDLNTPRKPVVDSSDLDTAQNKASSLLTLLGKVGTAWNNHVAKNADMYIANTSAGYAHGTFHATNNAFARGTLKSYPSGLALGGEEGQELVVRDGKYFTIGDDSAEFFQYKRGDIIFDAQQTKQLLSNGEITSGDTRGQAFVRGNAFPSGSLGSGQLRHTNDYVNAAGEGFNSSVAKSASKAAKATSDSWEEAIKKVEKAFNDGEKNIITGDQHLIDASKSIANNKEVITQYQEDLKRLKELGGDLNQTIFGNIDTNNRQILEWTQENLDKYRDILENSYEMSEKEINDMLGSHSTVFGSSSNYDGIEIAFSPMLQTPEGAKLLDQATVDKYIFGLIEQAKQLHENGDWDSQELIALDVEGLTIDGQQIKQLLADIGDTAEATGEKMHYTGDLGSIAEGYKQIAAAAEEAGMSVEEYINLSEQGLNYHHYQEYYDSLLDVYNEFYDETVAKAQGSAKEREKAEEDLHSKWVSLYGSLKSEIGNTYSDINSHLRSYVSQSVALYTTFYGKVSGYGKEMLAEQKAIAMQIKNAYQGAFSAMSAMIGYQISSLQAQLKAMNAPLQAAKDAADREFEARIRELNNEKHAIQEKINAVQDEIDSHQEEIDSIQEIIDGYEEQIKKIEKIIDSYEDEIDTIQEVIDHYEDLIDDIKDIIDEYKYQQDAIDEYIDANDKIIKNIEKQIKANDKVAKQKQKSIDELEKEIESIRRANEERQQAINLAKAEYDLNRANNQKTQMVYTESGFEYQADASAQKTANDNYRDAKTQNQTYQIEKKVTSIKDEIAAIDAESDKLQESIDAINEENDALQESIDAIQEKIDALEKEITQYERLEKPYQEQIDDIEKIIEGYEKQIKAIQELEEPYKEQIEEIEKVIKALQKKIDAYQKEINAIDREIEAIQWEKEQIDQYYDDLMKANEDFINAQIEALEKQQAIYDKFAQMFSFMANLQLVQQLGYTMEDVFTRPQEVCEQMTAKIGMFYKALGDHDALNAFMQTFNMFGGVVTAVTAQAEGDVTGLVQNYAEGIGALPPVTEQAASGIQNAVSQIGGATRQAAGEVGQSVSEMSQSMGEVDTSKIEEIPQKLGEVSGSVQQVASDISGQAELINLAFGKMADGGKKIEYQSTLFPGWVQSIVTSLSGMSEILSGISQEYGTTSDSAKAFLDSLGNDRLNQYVSDYNSLSSALNALSGYQGLSKEQQADLNAVQEIFNGLISASSIADYLASIGQLDENLTSADSSLTSVDDSMANINTNTQQAAENTTTLDANMTTAATNMTTALTPANDVIQTTADAIGEAKDNTTELNAQAESINALIDAFTNLAACAEQLTALNEELAAMKQTFDDIALNDPFEALLQKFTTFTETFKTTAEQFKADVMELFGGGDSDSGSNSGQGNGQGGKSGQGKGQGQGQGGNKGGASANTNGTAGGGSTVDAGWFQGMVDQLDTLLTTTEEKITQLSEQWTNFKDQLVKVIGEEGAEDEDSVVGALTVANTKITTALETWATAVKTFKDEQFILAFQEMARFVDEWVSGELHDALEKAKKEVDDEGKLIIAQINEVFKPTLQEALAAIEKVVGDSTHKIIEQCEAAITAIQDLIDKVAELARVTGPLSITVGSAGGTTSATGTALAGGNAYPKGTGNWGMPKDSKDTLVGELGPELLVRDGHYQIIGQNSAEFRDIKKDDIIFNARQTQELFKYRGMRGAKPRGKSYADGKLDGFHKIEMPDIFTTIAEGISDIGKNVKQFTPVIMERAAEKMAYSSTHKNNTERAITIENLQLTMPNFNSSNAEAFMNDLRTITMKSVQKFNR